MGTRGGARGLAPPSAAVPVPVRTEGGQAPRGKGPVPKQYVEGLSGEPARLHGELHSPMDAVWIRFITALGRRFADSVTVELL